MSKVDDKECLLTVVIPVYNRAGVVRNTLDSIAAQTLRPLKVILVDNNSSDDTLAVLNNWKREVEASDFGVLILEETEPGAAAARNRGLREVKTPLTMFFDSDDRMLPTHCRRAVEGFDAHPEAGVIGWDCRYISQFSNRTSMPFFGGDFVWNNIFQGMMATQRYAAKTELFRKAGGWNPKCLGWDDIELGLRILMENPKIVKLKGLPTVEVIGLEDSITGIGYSGKALLWENALDLMEQTIAESKRYRRFVNLRRAILAGDYRKEGSRDEASRLISLTRTKERCPFYRLLNRIAYLYRGIGLPGASRLLRPLF